MKKRKRALLRRLAHEVKRRDWYSTRLMLWIRQPGKASAMRALGEMGLPKI